MLKWSDDINPSMNLSFVGCHLECSKKTINSIEINAFYLIKFQVKIPTSGNTLADFSILMIKFNFQ